MIWHRIVALVLTVSLLGQTALCNGTLLGDKGQGSSNHFLAPLSFIRPIEVKQEFIHLVVDHIFKHLNPQSGDTSLELDGIVRRSLVKEGFVIIDVVKRGPHWLSIEYRTEEGFDETIDVKVEVRSRVLRPIIRERKSENWADLSPSALDMMDVPLHDSWKKKKVKQKEQKEKIGNEVLPASVLGFSPVYNFNTASKKELMKLPGIGDKLSDYILEYRKNNGNFQSIEDLKKVHLIGDKRLINIKNFLEELEKNSPTSKNALSEEKGENKKETKSEKKTLFKRLLNLSKYGVAYLFTIGFITASYIFMPGFLTALGVLMLVTLFAGLLSMTEVAFMSISKDAEALNQLAKIKSESPSKLRQKLAGRALELTKNVADRVSTITVTKNALSISGGMVVSGLVKSFMPSWMATMVSTLTVMVLGENIPKSLGLSSKKVEIVLYASAVFPVFEKIFYPFTLIVRKLNGAARWLSHVIVNFKLPKQKFIPPWTKEIRKLLEKKWVEGAISDTEYHYLSGIIRFGYLEIGEILKKNGKKSQVTTLSPEIKIFEAKKFLDQKYYSRFPLVDRFGNYSGMLFRDDILLFSQYPEWKNKSLKDLFHHLDSKQGGKRRLFTFAKNTPASHVFDEFMAMGGAKMGILFDRRGKVAGVVTLEDLIEALFQKEIYDEKDLIKRHVKKNKFQSLMKRIMKETHGQSKVLENELMRLKRDTKLNDDVNGMYRDMGRLEDGLLNLSGIEWNFLFDLVYFGNQKEEKNAKAYLNSAKEQWFGRLAKWMRGENGYGKVFEALEDVMVALKEKHSDSSDSHFVQKTFIEFISLASVDKKEIPEHLVEFFEDERVVKAFQFLKEKNKDGILKNFVYLKEMVNVVQKAYHYEAPSKLDKLKGLFSTLIVASIFVGIPFLAYAIGGAVIGNFVLILMGVTFLSAIVSFIEAAIFSANKEMVEKLAYEGDKSAMEVRKILKKTKEYLPVMVFLSNLIKIPGGMLIVSFAPPFIGEVLRKAISTAWMIIFAKSIPKDLGLVYSIPLAKRMSVFLKFFSFIFRPAVFLMKALSFLVREYISALSFGKMKFPKKEMDERVMEVYSESRKKVFAELKKEWKKNGDEQFKLIDRSALKLFERGLRFFGDVGENVTVRDLLGNKNYQSKRMVYEISGNSTVSEARKIINGSPFSRIPIYHMEGDKKVYRGYAFKSDLLLAFQEQPDALVKEFEYRGMTEINYNTPAKEILEDFLKGRANFVLVKDNHGDMAGVLTMEDVVSYLLIQDFSKKGETKSTTVDYGRFEEELKRLQPSNDGEMVAVAA